jgi:hypothetical protein
MVRESKTGTMDAGNLEAGMDSWEFTSNIKCRILLLHPK